jgi:lysophospholipase L1-like esterase
MCEMMVNSKSEKHRKTDFKFSFWLISFLIIFLFLGALGAEIYMRCKSTYIIKNIFGSHHRVFIESDPNLLIQYTAKGRRLIPNANAVIRNHHLSRRDINVKINSLGFRDNEISAEKKDSEIRILVIGDSITWGDYLQANEVYVERIEYYLNKGCRDKKIEVINAGIGDVGLKEEMDILIDTGLSIYPDIVVVSFYLNDSRPPWGFPEELGYPGWLRRNSILASHLYNKFKLWQWMKEKGMDRFDWIYKQDRLDWRHDQQAFLELADMAKYDWGAAWDSESWMSLGTYFNKLKDLSKENQFKVIVVAFPVVYQIYADFLEDYPQRTLDKIARQNGFYYFDLLSVLRTHNNEKLYFDQCHPRVKTNDIIGKSIADYVQQEILRR